MEKIYKENREHYERLREALERLKNTIDFVIHNAKGKPV